MEKNKQTPLFKKTKMKNEIYYAKTKSHVKYAVKKDHVFIIYIRSYRTGDAHNLMAVLYNLFPNKSFRLDIIIAPQRKRALQFWKSEGFEIMNKIKHPGMRFYEMEKKNGQKRLDWK